MSTISGNLERGKSNPSSFGFIVFVVIVMFAFGIFVMTITAGHIRGVEFSATHFQLRSFEFYQIPVLKLQISPVWRSAKNFPIGTYLAAKSLIQVPSGSPARWDLVSLEVHADLQGDANLLIKWLENATSASDQQDWEQWSNDHPAAAAVFWPQVQNLADRQLYLLIPSLFVIARGEFDPQKLKLSIDHYLTTEQIAMAKDLADAKATTQARELLEEALVQDPANEPIRTALSDLPPAN